MPISIGAPVDDSTDKLVAGTGLSHEQVDKFKNWMAKKEGKYDTPPNKYGGYGGRYGMNQADLKEVSSRLKVAEPSYDKFLKDHNMQDQFFIDYTLANHEQLMKNKEYRDASPEKKAGILAGAHLSNPKTVESFMNGKFDAADQLGTHVSSYVNGAYRTVGGAGALYGPNWAPSKNAISSAQKTTDTEVVDMDPGEYLSLLPPIPTDEGSKAAGEHLNKSLSAGDQIESLPSLEVKPSNGNLKIVDNDGRHRALAALDAGLDTIPVAIRGVPEGGNFKDLIGEKTVPYQFNKIPKEIEQAIAPPAASVPPAQIGGVRAQPVPTPGPTPQPQPIANLQQPQKPDLYPQIVAGINKDIVSPAAQGYKGVAVPNPTDNVTAGQRIQNALATSAGRPGLGPQAPQNALSNVGAYLNPIGSAQAAESPPSRGITIRPAEGNISIGAPTDVAPDAGYNVGMDIIPPIINAISPFATVLPADIAALGAMRRGEIPANFQAWRQRADDIQATTQLPETAIGRGISNIIGSPGQMFGWAVENVLNAGGAPFGQPEFGTNAMPYIRTGMDVLAPVSLAVPGIGNALTRPIAPILKAPFKTAEQAGVKILNKVEPKELKVSGMPPQVMEQELQKARAAGIPLTPFDLAVPGEALDETMKVSLSNPQARGAASKFAQDRLDTSFDRTKGYIDDAFGNGSRTQLDKQLDSRISALEDKLNKGAYPPTERLKDINTKIQEKERGLAIPQIVASPPKLNRFGLPRTQKPFALTPDTELKRLYDRKDRVQAEIDAINNDIDNARDSKKALDWGQSILKPSVRPEDIANFIQNVANNPEALENLKLSAGEALRDRIGVVRNEKAAQSVGVGVEAIQDKLASVLGPDSAQDYFGKLGMENKIIDRSHDLQTMIKGESLALTRQRNIFHRMLEAAGHAVFGHGAYWGLRTARTLWDLLSSGGRLTPGSTKQAVVNALTDPNATIGRGKNLLAIPPLPAGRQNALNNIRYGLPAAMYSTQEPTQP